LRQALGCLAKRHLSAAAASSGEHQDAAAVLALDEVVKALAQNLHP
jgi:hypothetical protein